MVKMSTKKGFTLIELMIVVAIIGILAAIAIPQFAQMVAKSQEGATKGNLGSLRSALSIYYGDTEGFYPTGATLGELTASQKYLNAIPAANMPRTNNNTIGHSATSAILTGNIGGAAGTDAGGWLYDNSGIGGNTTWGQIVSNCYHSDLKGSRWSAY
jgi:prepilin-type N-terminal cleavage/methylation domain-containing protein